MQGEEGITLKLSTLFDITPDKEIKTLISAKAIREQISTGLIAFGVHRCKDRLRKIAIAKEESDLKRRSTSSNITPDTSYPGLSIANSPPSYGIRSNRRSPYSTKLQIFGPKRHFSTSRDDIYQDIFLRQGHPRLHIWRTLHQLSQEVYYQGFSLGRFRIIHQMGVPSSSHWSVDQKSVSQLVNGITHLGVPGYVFGYNVKLTHQAIKKAVRICSPRSPVGVLSRAVSLGILGCLY